MPPPHPPPPLRYNGVDPGVVHLPKSRVSDLHAPHKQSRVSDPHAPHKPLTWEDGKSMYKYIVKCIIAKCTCICRIYAYSSAECISKEQLSISSVSLVVQ